MYLIPLWTTLCASILTGLLGRSIGRAGAQVLCLSGMLCSCIASYFIFYEVCVCQSTCYIRIWLSVDLLDISGVLTYDPLASIMLAVITTVSLCAQVYSIGYMKSDPHSVRFFAWLSLFSFFMILLVLSENVLQLFIGWEGVGVCSYLLINFWYARIQASKSSLLAIMTNKIGDIALLLGISVLCNLLRTVDFVLINACMDTVLSTEYTYITELSFMLEQCSTFIFECDDADVTQKKT